MDISQSFKETKGIIKGIIQQPAGINHTADLTSAEIGELWDTYMYYSILTCVFKYFEKVASDNHDNDVAQLLSSVLMSFDTRLKWITDTFNRENLKVPAGFSHNGVNIDAPQLYSNSYILYYFKSMLGFSLTTNTLNINMAARPDVRDFYKEILTAGLDYNERITNLMLERGILQKHPSIKTSDKVDYTKSPGFLAGFIGKRHSLLAREIANLYTIALSNHIGRVLLTGFSQVAASDKVRDYMNKGVKIADDIINTMTFILKEDDIPTPLPGDAITIDSNKAPFSDKLMMLHVQLLNTVGAAMYTAAMGASMRHDLHQKYALIMANTGRFAEEGIKIIMDNGWMEEPPQIVDREAIAKGIH